MDKKTFVADRTRAWQGPRWKGITRTYTPDDVWKVRGTVQIDHTLARLGCAKLWELLHNEPYIHTLSAITGGQAVQQVKAGLKAIYVSGWQVAGDVNTARETYPDQSLYPADSVPTLLERLNNALLRADEIDHMRGNTQTDWIVP